MEKHEKHAHKKSDMAVKEKEAHKDMKHEPAKKAHKAKHSKHKAK